MMDLRTAIQTNLESYLPDWDEEHSFSSQVRDLAEQLEQTVNEHSPRRYIPNEAICFFKDGDMWCCVNADFVNLQESPAGFGETFELALENLQKLRAAIASVTEPTP